LHAANGPVQVALQSGAFALIAQDNSRWSLSNGGGGTANVSFSIDNNVE